MKKIAIIVLLFVVAAFAQDIYHVQIDGESKNSLLDSLIGSLSEDTTPTLGGNLNASSHAITNASEISGQKIYSPQTTVTYTGSNIFWNASTDQSAFVTLTNNAVLQASGGIPGMACSLLVRQDATGGRTLGYTNLVKFSQGITPVITTNGNRMDIICFQVYSTNSTLTNFLAVATQNIQ